MYGLMIFAGPPIYHLPVIFVTVALVCIIVLLARLLSDISRNLEKFDLRTLYPATLRVRFDHLSSINFRDINGFSKVGLKPPIRNHPGGFKVVVWYHWRFYGYDILLVIIIISEAVSSIVSEI